MTAPVRPPPSWTSPIGLDLRWAVRSERAGRPNNEDSYLVARLRRGFDSLATNLEERDVPRSVEQSGWMVAVADGMGGAAAGEVASALALSAGVRFALAETRWTLRTDEDSVRDLEERARKIFRSIDLAVAHGAREGRGFSGMRTTLTVGYVVQRLLLLLHVGDSRAYRFHGGELERLTRDQTIAQRLADNGAIRPEQVARHQLRHVLEQAVGRGDGDLDIEVRRVDVEPGDRLLFNTDGLTDAVRDEEIAAILAREADDERACAALTELALKRHASDNVTAVVVTLVEA